MGRGLSGGERRRLTIACALVRSPSVLVLDEPTTGLDSSSSHQILVVLKKLARGGRSIIITVHAPRSDAFELFDQLLILAQGKSVFCGKTIDALPYFADLGYNLPDATNPLDFLIDVTSIDERDLEREAQSSKRVSALRNAWAKEMQENGPPEDGATKRRSRLSVQFRQHTNRPGTFSQAVTLTRRGLLFIRRDWGQNLGYAVQFIVLAVAMGAAFYRPPETPGGIQSLKTNIFQSIVCTYYLSFIIYIYVLCKLLVVFDREREDQLYDSTVAYLVSLVFTYLPVNVIYPTIFSVIFYFMSGLRQDDLAANLFSYIASNIMQQLAAFGYALCAASINRSFAQAVGLNSVVSLSLILCRAC
jgi:riboflavin transporter FmnP